MASSHGEDAAGVYHRISSGKYRNETAPCLIIMRAAGALERKGESFERHDITRKRALFIANSRRLASYINYYRHHFTSNDALHEGGDIRRNMLWRPLISEQASARAERATRAMLKFAVFAHDFDALYLSIIGR